MHEIVADVVLVWLLALVVVLTLFAARNRTSLVGVLALEALSLLLVLFAAVLALAGDEPGFMTLALVLGLLGFVQTVAAAQFLREEEDRG